MSAPAAPFAPGSHLIAAHGGGGFAFAGMSLPRLDPRNPRRRPSARRRRPRRPRSETLAPLFDEIAARPGSIEFLVLGSGERLAPPPPALRVGAPRGGPALRRHGDRTGAARLQRHAVRGPQGRGGPDRDAVTAAPGDPRRRWRRPSRPCAAIAREHARDQWLAALFAPAAARDGLNALAAFNLELAQATRRARDPNLAAIRLAWWREAALGAREAEAAGNPAALAMLATMRTFALPERWSNRWWTRG